MKNKNIKKGISAFLLLICLFTASVSYAAMCYNCGKFNATDSGKKYDGGKGIDCNNGTHNILYHIYRTCPDCNHTDTVETNFENQPHSTAVRYDKATDSDITYCTGCTYSKSAPHRHSYSTIYAGGGKDDHVCKCGLRYTTSHAHRFSLVSAVKVAKNKKRYTYRCVCGVTRTEVR